MENFEVKNKEVFNNLIEGETFTFVTKGQIYSENGNDSCDWISRSNETDLVGYFDMLLVGEPTKGGYWDVVDGINVLTYNEYTLEELERIRANWCPAPIILQKCGITIVRGEYIPLAKVVRQINKTVAMYNGQR